jgi:hypothetical protein
MASIIYLKKLSAISYQLLAFYGAFYVLKDKPTVGSKPLLIEADSCPKGFPKGYIRRCILKDTPADKLRVIARAKPFTPYFLLIFSLNSINSYKYIQAIAS